MATASQLCTDGDAVDDKISASIFEQAIAPSDIGVLEPSVRSSRVWLKLDLLVLPIIVMIYFFACLDTANVGNARIAGLQKTLGISDEQFSIALTVAIIPVVIVSILSSYLMNGAGGRFLLPVLTILQGLSSALQGVVTTYPAFLACRFFSGLFQGAITPCGVIYLSWFYPRRLLQLRVAVVLTSTALAPSISSLLAAGIVRLDGLHHRSAYTWLFVLEGAAAIACGFVCLFIMPKSPASVSILREPEKQYVACILDEDNVAAETYDHAKFLYDFRRILAQPPVLLNALAGFLADVTLCGLAVFLPSIVVGLGFEGAKAQFMSVPPFAVGAVFSVLVSQVSDRYGCRGLTTATCAAVSATGFAIYIASSQHAVRYMSLFLAVPGSCCTLPTLATWQSNNTAPLARRTIAIGFSSTVTQLGAILAVWLYGTISAPPDYTSATITLLAFQIGIILCAMSSLAYLRAENRRKKLAREEYLGQYGERPAHGDAIPNESIWFEYVM